MAESAEFGIALRRCKVISQQLMEQRQMLYKALFTGQAKFRQLRVVPGATGFHMTELRVVLDDGRTLVVKSGQGRVEDNWADFDPRVKELELERDVLNKKHHIFL